MAIGQWVKLGRFPCACHQCNDWMTRGDDIFETETGTYCCEACADEAESHDDGIMPREWESVDV